MANPRMDHTATLLVSGKVLIAGGLARDPSFTSFASAELYDPDSNTWSAAGSMATARACHTATFLMEGNVLVVGGGTSDASCLASAEIYDPAANIWNSAANMASARRAHTATRVQQGNVLVAGGYNIGDLASTESYDLERNE
jgi:N-acetylneuraminic acid mutarotase